MPTIADQPGHHGDDRWPPGVSPDVVAVAAALDAGDLDGFDDRPSLGRPPAAMRTSLAHSGDALGAALAAGDLDRAERIASRIGRSLTRWAHGDVVRRLRTRPRRPGRPALRPRPRRSSGRTVSGLDPPDEDPDDPDPAGDDPGVGA